MSNTTTQTTTVKTYQVIFGKEDKVPAFVMEMPASSLTAAINKSVKEIERMKKIFDRNNVDYSHLVGLRCLEGTAI